MCGSPHEEENVRGLTLYKAPVLLVTIDGFPARFWNDPSRTLPA